MKTSLFQGKFSLVPVLENFRVCQEVLSEKIMDLRVCKKERKRPDEYGIGLSKSGTTSRMVHTIGTPACR